MLFGWFYFDWTILIVLPAMFFAFWAQIKVSSTFEKYNRTITRSGLTAAEAARKMLDQNGLFNVQITQTPGSLTDHYDPRNRTLFLSQSVYASRSTAAIGVACHEAGHALQHAKGYAPLKARMAIIPICNLGSRASFPLFFIGLLVASTNVGAWLMFAGIAFFSLSTLFQLITLPVEFNASRRALEGMNSCGLLYGDELNDARKVLSAAAMTYVAALATSLLSLLRLIVIANNNRRR
ncbi:MAG: zinc metallopeptidase [Clostridia bacterium]|nr:zinc metallopeptidase [Clostridia bacterium]